MGNIGSTYRQLGDPRSGIQFFEQQLILSRENDDRHIEEAGAKAMAMPHARPFDITGRPMKGWVMVAQDGFISDGQLTEWLDYKLEASRPLWQAKDGFAFPYEFELARKYRGVFYHVHNEKMHFVPRVEEIPGLKLLEAGNDPKTPWTLEDISTIFASTGSANLMLHGTSIQVRAHIEELKSRNVFFQVECEDRKDAEDILDFVRNHSRVL